MTQIPLDTDVAAQRDAILQAIGTASKTADDPFVTSTFMTVAPGWDTIQISFVAEGAGFRNDFGWFLFDYDGSAYTILQSQILFPGIRETPTDEEGRSTSPFQTGAVASGESFEISAEGTDSDYYVGWFLRNPDGDVFYTVNELNENEEDHFGAAELDDGSGYYMGIDDQLGLGDRDYNDVVFFTSSESDLAPNPSVPEPGLFGFALLGSCLVYTVFARRRGLTRPPSARSPDAGCFRRRGGES